MKLHRRRKGLSLEALAVAVGTTRSTLSRIENGAGMSVAMLDRIVAACGDRRVTAKSLLVFVSAR